jgi:hypothetical protein
MTENGERLMFQEVQILAAKNGFEVKAKVSYESTNFHLYVFPNMAQLSSWIQMFMADANAQQN